MTGPVRSPACLRGGARGALDGVEEPSEGWPGPPDSAASLPGLVLDLAVGVDGEEALSAVLVAGDDAQELADRVTGDGDGHVGQFVVKGEEGRLLARHAERPTGELSDAGDERPFLHAAVGRQEGCGAFRMGEGPEWGGVARHEAGGRGYRGRSEKAAEEAADPVNVTVAAAGAVFRGGGVSHGVYLQVSADGHYKRAQSLRGRSTEAKKRAVCIGDGPG